MEIPWEEIKAEYITRGTSYAQLAARYGISKSGVGKRALRESWADARRRYGDGVCRDSVAEAMEDAADRLRSIRQAAEKASGIISDRMVDCADLSPRDMRAYVASLRDLDVLLRNAYGVPTPAEAGAQEIARQRLELERERVKAQTASDTDITVELAPELEEWAR